MGIEMFLVPWHCKNQDKRYYKQWPDAMTFVVFITLTVTPINSESNVDTQESTLTLSKLKMRLSLEWTAAQCYKLSFISYLTWADQAPLRLLSNHGTATGFPATSWSRIITLPDTCLHSSDTHCTAAWPGRPFWQVSINCMEMEG